MDYSEAIARELDEVRKIAMKKGYITNPKDLYHSPISGKRYRIALRFTKPAVKYVDFGSAKHENYVYHTIEGKKELAEKKRKAFHSRFKNFDNYKKDNKHSALFYSKNLLW